VIFHYVNIIIDLPRLRLSFVFIIYLLSISIAQWYRKPSVLAIDGSFWWHTSISKLATSLLTSQNSLSFRISRKFCWSIDSFVGIDSYFSWLLIGACSFTLFSPNLNKKKSSLNADSNRSELYQCYQKLIAQAMFAGNYQWQFQKHSPNRSSKISSKTSTFNSILTGAWYFFHIRLYRKYSGYFSPKFPSHLLLDGVQNTFEQPLCIYNHRVFSRGKLASGQVIQLLRVSMNLFSKNGTGDRLQVCRNGRDLLDC